MPRATPLFLSFALAVLSPACGGNVILDTGDAGPSVCVPDGGACATSTDCCPGDACTAGACVPGCQSDSDCAPPCDVCSPAGVCENACSG